MMNWNNFEFNNPEFLWLLTLIPFLATWFFLVRKKETATLTVSSLKGFNTTSSFLPKLKPLLPIIRLISLSLLSEADLVKFAKSTPLSHEIEDDRKDAENILNDLKPVITEEAENDELE